MQSTEEYLDSLLASVSDEENHNNSNMNHKKHHKSIEDLDESELTEEALQKQLALLLGLETEDDMDYDDGPEDDFMAQYAAQMADSEVESFDIGVQTLPDDSIPSVVQEPIAQVMPEPAPVAPAVSAPATSDSGVLSPDEIAALFASMETESAPEAVAPAEPEPTAAPVPSEPEPVTSVPSAPATSDSGVLSPDEIAALFASMETESAPEAVAPAESEPTATAPVPSEPEPVTSVPSAPATSDSGVLSPDEIAALFASMGGDDSDELKEESDVTDEVLLGKTVDVTEEPLQETVTGLTREELEELGLGDIADILVDGEQEILSETIGAEGEAISVEEAMEVMSEIDSTHNEEGQIVEIPDFDFGEEMLLELENVDAMLEATAKMAEEEIVSADADSIAEEDIMAMLSQFEEESIQESMAAQEAEEVAAQEAVNKVLEEETQPDSTETEMQDGGKKKGKKAKKEKVKKEKKEKPVKEKKDKVSLKDKIFAFMFEDESLEAENVQGDKIPLGDSDELSYIDLPVETLQEPKPEKKKKEKASKKDKKAKKASGNNANDENAKIEAELAAEDKKKAKKKEKPKKEKKAKKVVIADMSAAEATEKDSKRGIGPKGIVATLLVCASLLGLILVGAYVLPMQLSLITARTAFYAQDYEEATLRLMGRDLNDSDRILYDKASLLYGLEERYHQSEIYLKSGQTKDALDSLLQGVVACNKEEVLAGQLGIEMEWKLSKDLFVTALQENFGLDAETVEAICALRNPDYTVAVENILAGRVFDDKSAYGGETSDAVVPDDAEKEENAEDGNDENLPGGLNPDELEDLLPEEEAILEQMQQEASEAEEISESDAEVTGDNELYSGSVEGGEVNFVE